MPPAGRPRSFDRDAALKKAMHVFWAKGFEGTTMMDLVEAIGVKAPSVYAAFGNKDAIFEESIALYLNIIAEGPLRELKGEDVFKAVENSLCSSIELFTSPENPSSCLIMSGAINCAPENKRHEEKLKQHRQLYKDVVKERFDLALKNGQLKSSTNVTTLAEYVLTVVQGFAIRAKDGASKDDLLASCKIALIGIATYSNNDKQ